MPRLALVLLLAGGCTLLYGPPKAGKQTHVDLGARDLAAEDLASNPDLVGIPPGSDLAAPPVAWSQLTSSTLQDLHAITGCSAADLFAPGTGGTVDRATTGTWAPKLVGAADLFATATSSCANIYVVGKAGTLYFSSDGTTFKLQTQGGDWNGVWANGVGVAAVGTGGAALFASLGGAKWFTKSSGTTADLQAVWGAGAVFYAAGANGTILRSTNSGQSWTARTVGSATLRGGWASASGADVYVVGDGGVILHSSDAGSTWPAASSGTSQALNAVWGATADDVYAVGAGGTILRSVDGGVTWTAESSNTGVTLRGIWGASASDIYAVGDAGTILHRP